MHLSRLHHTCGWTFWSDQEMFRWWSKILPKHGCNSHIWFHHVTPIEIRRLYGKYKNLTRETRTINITLSRNKVTLHVNHTGCKKFEMGLPEPSEAKMSNLPMVGNRKRGFLFIKHVNFISSVKPPCEI